MPCCCPTVCPCCASKLKRRDPLSPPAAPGTRRLPSSAIFWRSGTTSWRMSGSRPRYSMLATGCDWQHSCWPGQHPRLAPVPQPMAAWEPVSVLPPWCMQFISSFWLCKPGKPWRAMQVRPWLVCDAHCRGCERQDPACNCSAFEARQHVGWKGTFSQQLWLHSSVPTSLLDRCLRRLQPPSACITPETTVASEKGDANGWLVAAYAGKPGSN